MRPLILPLTVVIGLIVLPIVALLVINGYPTVAFNTVTARLFTNNNIRPSGFVDCKKDTLAGKDLSHIPVGLTNNNNNSTSISITNKSLSLPDLFDRVDDSVVQVTSKQLFSNPKIIINGNPVKGQASHLGSGFIFDNGGHVVTNDHLIGDGTESVDVTFIDGNSYSANVIGRDILILTWLFYVLRIMQYLVKIQSHYLWEILPALRLVRKFFRLETHLGCLAPCLVG